MSGLPPPPPLQRVRIGRAVLCTYEWSEEMKLWTGKWHWLPCLHSKVLCGGCATLGNGIDQLWTEMSVTKKALRVFILKFNSLEETLKLSSFLHLSKSKLKKSSFSCYWNWHPWGNFIFRVWQKIFLHFAVPTFFLFFIILLFSPSFFHFSTFFLNVINNFFSSVSSNDDFYFID